ncbi:hypothetical protein [Streptomyces sp. NPDC047043]|uniref:hypothetical protein n=1 Tax=Streptomyces sp. NPDC047043 TaxID=3154497 RepID=UPI0033C38615
MTTERPDDDAEEQGAVEEQGAEGTEAPGVTEGDTETPEAGAPEGEGAEAEETTASEAATAEGDDDDIPDATPGPEAEHPRPPRRRSPVLIASVAAAVLLVGGGGAYLAASAAGGSGGGTNSGTPGDDGTPPPLALDGYSEGGTNGIAPGEPNPYGVTYKIDGSLPDGPDSAPVYRASGEVTKDEVARLAKALGLDGTPVATGQAWQVGPGKDGSGPSLVVNKQAPGTWTFHRYAAGTDACQSMTACTKDPANPAGDTVSEAAAKKAAAPVLKALGQDDAKVDASQVMGAQRAVNADPVVGGLPTYGWSTGLTVSAQGEVVGGSGQLKAPVKGDTYPVLGAQKTLDLMNAAPTTDHRMGIGGCASPVPLKDRLEAPCGQSTSTSAATATPAKETVTVDKAVFGLAARAVDGRQALVPSWLFQVKGAGAQNGFTVTYPAVDPKYLASNSPSGEPTPSATAPSDEPTSGPVTRDVAVEGYTADGRDLTVTFTGGVCASYEAKASENSDKVTVTVTETKERGKVCIMIAKEIEKTVQLDEPLGDRKVVGSDGKEIPQVKQGARLPRTSAGVQ